MQRLYIYVLAICILFIVSACGSDSGATVDAASAAVDAANDAATDAVLGNDCGGTMCEGNEFCSTDQGCGGTPTCELSPNDCLGELPNPLCGCDGSTYKNACLAMQAGTSVRHFGTCESLICDADTCEESERCQRTNCSGLGTCVLRPNDCAGDPINEVCGCDGQTYPNDCLAQLAGTSVQYAGACIAGQCGDVVCLQSTFCSFDLGCSGSGSCELRSNDCLGELVQPVCGCDDQSYDNPCEASAAGTDVQHAGACL